MANLGYQSRSIISGVSTRPYALRDDGHMSDASENCMLSPKFGLTKRPGTTFLQTVEANSAANYGVFIPLLSGDAERIIIGFGATQWQVFSKGGTKSPICHYPSSQSSTATAAATYAASGANFSPQYTSTTTIGDVTFIADSQVTPRMLDAASTTTDEDGRIEKWLGYTVPAGTIEDPDGVGSDKIQTVITNDDAFVYWIKSVVFTTEHGRNHKLTVLENIGGTITPYTVNITTKKTGGNEFEMDNTQNIWPSPYVVCGCMSYALSNKKNGAGHRFIQATSLDGQSYGTPAGDIVVL